MRFHDDMSYIDKNLVNRGLMKIVPYSIRLERYYTEDQKEANRAYAESHTAEEWRNRCDAKREEIAASNFKLMEYLKSFVKLGQYEKKYDKDYVLWFWCNDLYNTTNGRQTGRDYSYITLTFMDRSNYEVNELIYEEIKKLISNYPADNIQAIFQYSQIEVPEQVDREAENIFNKCRGNFVTYGGYCIGRLQKCNGEYIFMKKNAKKYGIKLDAIDVCRAITV